MRKKNFRTVLKEIEDTDLYQCWEAHSVLNISAVLSRVWQISFLNWCLMLSCMKTDIMQKKIVIDALMFIWDAAKTMYLADCLSNCVK